ncbi:zinc finger protein 26-like isoform X4 [Gracilaria domingensis]|nr:zinc finger protein 26-like isoform X4 [Gracilaria domingensis]
MPKLNRKYRKGDAKHNYRTAFENLSARNLYNVDNGRASSTTHQRFQLSMEQFHTDPPSPSTVDELEQKEKASALDSSLYGNSWYEEEDLLVADFSQKDQVIRQCARSKSSFSARQYSSPLQPSPVDDIIRSPHSVERDDRSRTHRTSSSVSTNEITSSNIPPFSLRPAVRSSEYEGSEEIREKRKYKCSKCNQNFISKASLWNHGQTHTKIDENCKFCGKHFTSKTRMNSHVRRIHTGPKWKESCSVCNAAFTRKDNMKAHMKSFHQDYLKR